jgi:hypothetical protein
MVVPVHAMKRQCIAPLILNLGTGWENSRPGRFNLGKEPQYPPILPVWTFWRGNKTVAPTGIQIPDRSARSLVRRLPRLEEVRMKNINTFLKITKRNDQYSSKCFL